MEPRIISLLRPFFCEALIECGMRAQETYSISEVVTLLDQMDYAISEPMLRGWQSRQLVAAGDELTEAEILPIVAGLELRRSWKSAPSKHDDKKGRTRLSRESLPHAEVCRVLDSVSIYDSWFLLSQMLQADERSQREEIFEILAARLDPSTCEFRPHVPSDSTESWKHVE